MEDLKGTLAEDEVMVLLRQMFEIGAIGLRSPAGGRENTDFAYRRVAGGGSFTTKKHYVLHNALTVAWNRPWVPPSE
jgi:hypothetical protein